MFTDSEAAVILTKKEHCFTVLALQQAITAALKTNNLIDAIGYIDLVTKFNRMNPHWRPYALPEEMLASIARAAEVDMETIYRHFRKPMNRADSNSGVEPTRNRLANGAGA